jgi:predicted Zn-dependent peptidase
MAIPLPFEHPGLSLTFAFPNVGVEPAKLEKAIDKEVAKVRKELITDRELQKLKNQFESRIINQNTSIAQRATNLSRYYTYFKDPGLINEVIDKYNSVTKKDIKRVANKYFREDNRVVLYYLPESEKTKQESK